MRFNFVSQSPARTEKVARMLGAELRALGKKRGHAFCIALSGELGAGKTLFVKGLARGLGLHSPIQSPTFIIMRRHALARRSFSKGGAFKNFWHMDCYRLKKQSELTSLHFREILKDPKNIVAIEWAERIKKLLPKDTLWILLSHDSPTVRAITLHHAGR